jgi:hypothetical protein
MSIKTNNMAKIIKMDITNIKHFAKDSPDALTFVEKLEAMGFSFELSGVKTFDPTSMAPQKFRLFEWELEKKGTENVRYSGTIKVDNRMTSSSEAQNELNKIEQKLRIEAGHILSCSKPYRQEGDLRNWEGVYGVPELTDFLNKLKEAGFIEVYMETNAEANWQPIKSSIITFIKGKNFKCEINILVSSHDKIPFIQLKNQ